MLGGCEIYLSVIWLKEYFLLLLLFKYQQIFSVQHPSACISGSFLSIPLLLCLQADIACLQKYVFILELLFFRVV